MARARKKKRKSGSNSRTLSGKGGSSPGSSVDDPPLDSGRSGTCPDATMSAATTRLDNLDAHQSKLNSFLDNDANNDDYDDCGNVDDDNDNDSYSDCGSDCSECIRENSLNDLTFNSNKCETRQIPLESM